MNVAVFEREPRVIPDWQAVDSIEILDQLLAQPSEEPVVLFKHDPYCPISRAAVDELALLVQPVAVVDVEHQRDVAAEVTRRTGVKHESPQVLILEAGRPVWNASLRAITRAAVERALFRGP